jgi:lysophospholipase L1-like esterase
MKTTLGLPSLRPLARALCTLTLAGAVAFSASAQPAAPAQPGQPLAATRGGAPGGGRGPAAPIVIGPAAPVPPAVAIPRPTAAEITQANDVLKKFVAGDSTAKALLAKYPGLIAVEPPRPNYAATYTQTTQRMGARHEGFVERAKQGDIDLLFHGDSITDFWSTRGKTVFDKYFGAMKVANFAISGDRTEGVLWGLKNGEGQGFSPKAIMLMIGTNNTGTGNSNVLQAATGPEIAEGVGAVVMEMRKDFPNAKILLLAIFPRADIPAYHQKNEEANKIIAKLHDGQHVFFMDIGPKFLSPDGTLSRDIMGDLLHPTEKGYEIWAEAVKDKLAELMK